MQFSGNTQVSLEAMRAVHAGTTLTSLLSPVYAFLGYLKFKNSWNNELFACRYAG